MTAPRVRLRDVTLDDVDLLEMWERPEYSSEYNDFGLPPRGSLRGAVSRGPLRGERNGMLIVERISEGSPIGTVGWHDVRYGPNDASRAWNVGISLVPDARGHGYGGEAQRLLAQELFDTTDTNRVEASTDVENIPEQRALEKAGFTREGIQRGAQSRGGRYHDLVTFARLRTDP
jgi:RimJ/RimL family protein N-acetyltransferase